MLLLCTLDIDGILPIGLISAVPRRGFPTRAPTETAMSSAERHRIAAALSDRAGRDPSAARVATTSLEFWREINAALTPVLGERGVDAMRERALFLTVRTHAWLGTSESTPSMIPTVEAFYAALATQSADASLSGARAFFEAFHDLLASMIGTDLTGRLLRLADDSQSGGTSAKATS